MLFSGCAFAQQPDFSALVPQLLPSVVHITIGGPRSGREPAFGDAPNADALASASQRGPRASGSGIVIGEDGYILTVAYVIEKDERLLVRLHDGREMYAQVIGSDRRSSVALLKIPTSGLAAAKIGDPYKLRLAERVYAIGRLPSGRSANVTDGIVSVIEARPENPGSFLQITAPLYPGMGGGPLVNQAGQVVGVNAMVYSRASGLGLAFAIPIDHAMRVAAELRAHGRVQRGSLGILIQEVTMDTAILYGMSSPSGALVNTVQKGSPAERAGVQRGDIVSRIGGEDVREVGDVIRLVSKLKPGSRVTVELRRMANARLERVEMDVVDAGD